MKIKGDSEVRVVPDQALLVAPSEIKFTVAREEKQDAIQTIDIGVAPGQRITLPLRNELFGGGTVKVDLGSPDGNPVAPVVVNIYTANNENGDPVTTFKSDSTSPVLPSGDYIVSVRTPLAGRYTVTINPNQSVVLPFPLGYLNVNYTDASGKPINRGLVVYIASMTEMQRLNLSVDEMRRTPYGLAINLTTASKVMVPAGIYKVMIADLNDTSQDNLKVDAGQTVPVNLQVSGQ